MNPFKKLYNWLFSGLSEAVERSELLLVLALLFVACAGPTGPDGREEKPGFIMCGFSKDGKRDSCWETTAARQGEK